MEILNLIDKDPIFELVAKYKADTNPKKINLGIGAFATEFGEPFVLPIIQSVAKELPTNNYNYLPISGDPFFLQKTGELILGNNNFSAEQFAMQSTCGGTHACSLYAHFAKISGIKNIILPIPSWVNHKSIFSDLNIINIEHLNDNFQFNIEGYLEVILKTNDPTILLLHGGSTHNPTGINLQNKDIARLVSAIKDKLIYVLIDFAYLGLGTSINVDSEIPQLLAKELPNVAIAFSYSKNATLYCHRTGALFIKTQQKQIIESHLQSIFRKTISNPPAFGQKVMNMVFEKHEKEWHIQLNEMRQNIDNRKENLVIALEGEIDYLRQSSGMFGMLKLSLDQIEKLQKEFSIYIPKSGRICFAGIRTDLLEYLAKSLQKVI